MKRAYSILDIKKVDEEKRIIFGVATTPSPDLVDDIVEPRGAEFELPIPFLWQHDADRPVGHVTRAKVTAAGIDVEIHLKKTDEPGLVKDRLDAAWQDIKLGLVRGLSIGFKGIETAKIEGSYGLRFLKWMWLELSAVTIAANQEASITTIKNIDTELLALSGEGRSGSKPAAEVSAKSVTAKPVKLESKTMKQTIAEQIAAFAATRSTKAASLQKLTEESGEKGETFSAEQQQEFDRLDTEIKSLDEHIARLKVAEQANLSAVKPIDGKDTKAAGDSRAGLIVVPASAKKELPKGTAFVRMVGALAAAKGNRFEAAMFAERWKDSTPEVAAVLKMPVDLIEKVAVAAGTTTDSTWAEPLVQYNNMASEFIEYLRPMTIIGRISGFRNVPFKIKVPRQTGGATVNWVGESKVKPLSALAFDSVTLEHTKIAGIIPLSEELVRFSSPSAEALVRADLASSIVAFMDREFVDPTKAAASGVSPASITNGVSAVAATGTTAAAFRANVRTMMAGFLTNNVPVATGHWIMTQTQALAFSMMQTSLGTPEFPGITMQGGTLLGFPVVASENIPATGGSPTDGSPIIFAVAGEIMLADDGGVNIDMSREASLQMESTPDSPATASTVLVSLWQHNMIAIKAERFINWVKRRSTAVGYISYAKYAE
jgi:HK97 family phage major capsid protein/HK97 family phage prohead protease